MTQCPLDEARKTVREFAEHSSVIRDHHDAMECRDCEDFLERGIHAFESLIRADQFFRLAVAEGSLEYDPVIEDALEKLFRVWLDPCDRAYKWVDSLHQRGLEIDNLDTFKRCETEVRAIVHHLNDDQLTQPIRELRDAAVKEHRDGETAKFI